MEIYAKICLYTILALGISILALLIDNARTVKRYMLFATFMRPPTALYPLHDPRRLCVAPAGAVRLVTLDGETLHGWVVYPTPVLGADASVTTRADQYGTVVLYLHGNGGTRGQAWRCAFYRKVSDATRAPVIAFDYRGYADNSGTPSESGLYVDALCMWNFVRESFPAARVVVWGHSLGSAVAVALCYELEHRNRKPPGLPLLNPTVHPEDNETKFLVRQTKLAAGTPACLVLEAPLTTIQEAARSHWITIPLRVPFLFEHVLARIPETFASIDRVGELTVPLIVLHGRSDAVLPYSMGVALHSAARMAPRKQLVLIDGAGHNECGAWAGTAQTVMRFVDG